LQFLSLGVGETHSIHQVLPPTPLSMNLLDRPV
jgi:hypothetical protein